MSFAWEKYRTPFLLSVFPEHATVLIFFLEMLINSCSPQAQHLLCWRRFGGRYETQALTRDQALICHFHSSPSFSTDGDVLWDRKMRAGEGELISMRHLMRSGTLETWMYTLVAGCCLQGLLIWWDVCECLSPWLLLGRSPTGKTTPDSINCQETESEMPLCKEQISSPSHGSRGSCLGLGTASSAQPWLVGLGQTLERGMAMDQLVEQVCLYLQYMPGTPWSLVGSGPSLTQHCTRKP